MRFILFDLTQIQADMKTILMLDLNRPLSMNAKIKGRRPS